MHHFFPRGRLRLKARKPTKQETREELPARESTTMARKRCTQLRVQARTCTCGHTPVQGQREHKLAWTMELSGHTSSRPTEHHRSLRVRCHHDATLARNCRLRKEKHPDAGVLLCPPACVLTRNRFFMTRARPLPMTPSILVSLSCLKSFPDLGKHGTRTFCTLHLCLTVGNARSHFQSILGKHLVSAASIQSTSGPWVAWKHQTQSVDKLTWS